MVHQGVNKSLKWIYTLSVAWLHLLSSEYTTKKVCFLLVSKWNMYCGPLPTPNLYLMLCLHLLAYFKMNVLKSCLSWIQCFKISKRIFSWEWFSASKYPRLFPGGSYFWRLYHFGRVTAEQHKLVLPSRWCFQAGDIVLLFWRFTTNNRSFVSFGIPRVM